MRLVSPDLAEQRPAHRAGKISPDCAQAWPKGPEYIVEPACGPDVLGVSGLPPGDKRNHRNRHDQQDHASRLAPACCPSDDKSGNETQNKQIFDGHCRRDIDAPGTLRAMPAITIARIVEYSPSLVRSELFPRCGRLAGLWSSTILRTRAAIVRRSPMECGCLSLCDWAL